MVEQTICHPSNLVKSCLSLAICPVFCIGFYVIVHTIVILASVLFFHLTQNNKVVNISVKIFHENKCQESTLLYLSHENVCQSTLLYLSHRNMCYISIYDVHEKNELLTKDSLQMNPKLGIQFCTEICILH